MSLESVITAMKFRYILWFTAPRAQNYVSALLRICHVGQNNSDLIDLLGIVPATVLTGRRRPVRLDHDAQLRSILHALKRALELFDIRVVGMKGLLDLKNDLLLEVGVVAHTLAGLLLWGAHEVNLDKLALLASVGEKTSSVEMVYLNT